MKVVTYATHSDGAFEYLRQSFEKFKQENDEFVVLGWKQKWQGFGHRILAYRDYAMTCSPEEIILCVDAHDVLLTASLRGLETQFLSTKKESPCIIMSTERQTELYKLYTHYCAFGLVDRSAICAGVFIGMAADITQIISDVCKDGTCNLRHFDDQKEFVCYANNYPTSIQLDINWDMFATAGHFDNFSISELEFSSNGTLKAFSKDIYVMHFPGNVSMKEALVKLGYDPKDLSVRQNYLLHGVIHCVHTFPMIQFLWMTMLFICVVFIIWWIYRIKQNGTTATTYKRFSSFDLPN